MRVRVRKTLYYVIDIDQFHAPNAKLKIRQYLILPDYRQNRQIFCTPIFLRLRYALYHNVICKCPHAQKTKDNLYSCTILCDVNAHFHVWKTLIMSLQHANHEATPYSLDVIQLSTFTILLGLSSSLIIISKATAHAGIVYSGFHSSHFVA